MPSERQQKIRSTSVTFHRLITVIMGLLPLGLLIMWANLDLAALSTGLTATEVGALTRTERFIAALLGFIPLTVALYALFHLRALFALYAQGSIFEAANVACFRKMGWALIALVPANTVFTAALSVLLSFDQPEGQRQLMISLSSDQLGLALVGAVILVISRVMAEAVDLSRDNAAII